MAYGHFYKENVEYVYQDKAKSPSKMLAKSFGYMAIGLDITAVVGFLIAYIFALSFKEESFDSNGALTRTGGIYFALMIVSFIALIIDSFAMNAVLARGKHSLWIPYIIYSVLMGVLMSSFVLVIDFWTIGEALGISAGVFLILFLIGYFSKVDLNPLAFVGLGFLMLMGFIGLFWGIFFFINPGAFIVYNVIFSFAFAIIMLIVVAADAYNIKRILATAQDNDNNLALYCAWTMYSDFIILFVRVLYIIALIKGRD